MAAPGWLVPVAAICILQTTTSFLARLIPIIAPAVSNDFGWSGSSIGYLTAIHSLGGLAMLVAGSNVLKQVGGMRTMQLTLLLGIASMMFFLQSSIAIALAACFVMGLSLGAATPAGSEVLQRYSPPNMRNLIFSIKQSGVPMGGIIAGLAIPALVVLTGWRIALFACALLILLPTLLTWRLSARLDRTSSGSWHFKRPNLQSLRALREPLRSLGHNPGLLRMSIVGSLFAISQSCWFTFTVIYLIDRLGYSLGLAGVVFAVMQVGGVVGRITLGWLSDYSHSATAPLSMAAILSAATTALLGLSSAAWPLWTVILLAFIAGGSAAGWNGVQIAEIARRAPPDLISETAAGSSVLIGLVNMLVPAAFAAFVALSDRYDLAFGLAGASTLLVLVFLPRDKQAAQ